MCMKLDDLPARLAEALGRFQRSGRPKFLAVTSGISSSCPDTCSASPASTSSFHGEATYVKVNWIRQSAPMRALHEAIEALLDAFWAQKHHEQGTDQCRNYYAKSEVYKSEWVLRAQHLSGPAALVFLEERRDSRTGPTTMEWSHIPEDVQGAVQHWYQLFRFELCELGYCKYKMRAGSDYGACIDQHIIALAE